MPQNLQNILLGLAITGVLCAASVSEAGVTSYSSAAAFDAAMTGLTTTSYANDGASGFPSGYTSLFGSYPNQYAAYGSNPVPFAGGTVTLPNAYIWSNLATFGASSPASNNAYGSNDFLLNWTTPGTETFTFSSPIYGFAMNGGGFVKNSGTGTFPDSPLALTFNFSGQSQTIGFSQPMVYDSGQWVSTNEPLTYMAFSSTTPFSSMTVTDTGGGFSTQDITLATGMASSISVSSTAPIPIPASLPLLLLGMVGLVKTFRQGRYK